MSMYWELVLKDGTKYSIPPDSVELVNRKMKEHDAIELSTATVPYSEIQAFRITERKYTDKKLIEAAARAFNEPVLTEDGSVVSRWVKRTVTQDKWQKYYAPTGYRHLREEAGMVVIAYKLPIHQMNMEISTECTEEEVWRLTSK